MRSLHLVYLFLGFCTLWSLASCTGEGFQVEIEPTSPLATLSTTLVASLPSATEMAPATATTEPELVSTLTLEMPATTTPIITPTVPTLLQADTATEPIMCRQFKANINIRQETNNESRGLMDFVFEQEDVITFLVWSDRPYPGQTPTPFAGTIEPGEGGPPPGVSLPELSQSSRSLLKGQIWNFSTGTLVESPVTDQDAIQSPCLQDCPLEVVGVTPDNSWQLLQITEATAEYQGLWLVNEETVYNLVPYVPFYSHWQWSNDSQMLWLIYTLQDIDGETYGSESMVVDLAAPAAPQVVFRSWETSPYQLPSPPNLLSPDQYKLVFSPENKTVLLYEYFGHSGYSSSNPPDNPLEVYVMDIRQNPPQLLDTYMIRYPFSIDWSDTLEDFIILELSDTGAVIYTLNRQIVYEIPKEVLKNINLDLVRRVAISPAQKNVVLVAAFNVWVDVQVYSCVD